VVVLLLVALAVAVLVSLLTPTGASATLEKPPAGEAGPTPAPSVPPQPGASTPADGAAPSPISADPGATGPAAAGTGSDAAGRPVLVHVLGAVSTPGLFELPAGARVVDAVAAAGGLVPGADQARVNLARAVGDGEQLYVPVVGEVIPLTAGPAGVASPSAGGPASGTATTVVDLNTATVADLDTLPRIGPGLAQRILDWRAANGRFNAAEDLLEVPGIGDRIFDGLRERVTV
jgi:competence protein ComEA